MSFYYLQQTRFSFLHFCTRHQNLKQSRSGQLVIIHFLIGLVKSQEGCNSRKPKGSEWVVMAKGRGPRSAFDPGKLRKALLAKEQRRPLGSGSEREVATFSKHLWSNQLRNSHFTHPNTQGLNTQDP